MVQVEEQQRNAAAAVHVGQRIVEGAAECGSVGEAGQAIDAHGQQEARAGDHVALGQPQTDEQKHCENRAGDDHRRELRYPGLVLTVDEPNGIPGVKAESAGQESGRGDRHSDPPDVTFQRRIRATLRRHGHSRSPAREKEAPTVIVLGA
ncbi:MAG: hypothetical protein FD152_967 [Xanthobacteraceae bacterium]|nr:MAG: hypothetical protein FD152_967 [Xanthobacteraceae bacterium]